MIEVRDLSGNAPYVAPRGSPGSPSGLRISGTFAANGESAEFTATGKINIRGGADGALDFGGGTIAIKRKLNNKWVTTSRDSAGNTAEYTAQFDFAVVEPELASYKLVLSGATSPNVDYYLSTTPRDSFGSA